MLEISNVTRRFGSNTAIDGVSFNVENGRVQGLIGPNGSGKTTMFNLISGFLKPNSGEVMFQGLKISGRDPSTIAALGLVRTFQLTSIYAEMPAIKSLEIGQHLARRRGARASATSVVGPCASAAAEREGILSFMGLSDIANVTARLLPGGTQRLLSIATALAARPAMLLLDEPTAGLNPTEKAVAIERVAALRDRGITILLVEHDMKSVMRVCERLCVINFGKKIAEGTPQEIREHPEVIKAYLGAPEDDHA